jgi:hypothetical protein
VSDDEYLMERTLNQVKELISALDDEGIEPEAWKNCFRNLQNVQLLTGKVLTDFARCIETKIPGLQFLKELLKSLEKELQEKTIAKIGDLPPELATLIQRYMGVTRVDPPIRPSSPS